MKALCYNVLNRLSDSKKLKNYRRWKDEKSYQMGRFLCHCSS